MHAKEIGIKIPNFGGSTMVGTEQWAIFLGDFYSEEEGCCSYEARARAIYKYIDTEKTKA